MTSDVSAITGTAKRRRNVAFSSGGIASFDEDSDTSSETSATTSYSSYGTNIEYDLPNWDGSHMDDQESKNEDEQDYQDDDQGLSEDEDRQEYEDIEPKSAHAAASQGGGFKYEPDHLDIECKNIPQVYHDTGAGKLIVHMKKGSGTPDGVLAGERVRSLLSTKCTWPMLQLHRSAFACPPTWCKRKMTVLKAI